MLIQTVALKDVRCFAYHGFYPEEQILGTHFLVSIEVKFKPEGDTEELSHTVNYELINNIIQQEMNNTQKLLETVVRRMIDRITTEFPFVDYALVGIKKLHPPMPGEIHHSYVQLEYFPNAEDSTDLL
jgi:dihydroneopterin aldolase